MGDVQATRVSCKSVNVASYSIGVMEYECVVSLILVVSSSDNYDLLDTLISCSVLSFKKWI